MRGSIRRTLMLYGLIASATLGLSVATFATLTLSDIIRVERRAHVARTVDEVGAPVPVLAPVLAGAYARGRLRLLLVFALSAALAVGVTWAWLASRVVLAPLKQLTPAVIGEAADGTGESGEAADEIDAVARSFRRAIRAVRSEQASVADRNSKLATLQARLTQADKLGSLGTLAAGVAHEIGNPLAAVMGYLRLLESGVPKDVQADVLARSIAELDRIHGTIKRMLSYARPDPFDEPPRPIATDRIVADTLELVRAHPAVRHAHVRYEAMSAPDELIAHASEGHVAQIVANLVINAGQATSGRSDALVNVRVARAGAVVEVRVEDNGPGVASIARAHIFDAFFTTKAQGAGTGLGLSVSRALAEAMGGTLDLDAAEVDGARFRLALAAVTKSGAP